MNFLLAFPALFVLGATSVASYAVEKRDRNDIQLKFTIKFEEHTSLQLHNPDKTHNETLTMGDDEHVFEWKGKDIGKENDNSKQWFYFTTYDPVSHAERKRYDCYLQGLKISDDDDDYELNAYGNLEDTFKHEETHLRCEHGKQTGNDYAVIDSDTLI